MNRFFRMFTFNFLYFINMVHFLYLLLLFLSCSSESEPESNMEREISGLRLSFRGDSTFLIWNSLNSPHKVTHIYIWADNTESLQIDLKEPSESQLNDEDLGLKRWVFAKKRFHFRKD
jgi:hypothetical protein